ncbi:Battrachocottus baikalensis orf1 and orf2 genes [Elysia marginata]|uniref:Battrachocottus baikalensis orf1 and orf2 genes n=1 Tax=Elysia marginata TaxID=1093978 RepID=A0AAV4JSR7_9GAST|nr:Battrachocottus baikalensis orf1 and orf2 genes [Elysia marginata]
MLYDFSSAFNTIQPHILCDKLISYDIRPSIVLWVLDYLTSRPQFVQLNASINSDVLTTNMGAPQGTVLSPFLFSLYTSDSRSSNDDCVFDKYADDTVQIGLITDNDDSVYVEQKDVFINWCKNNYLVLNVEKTKEMIIDFLLILPT